MAKIGITSSTGKELIADIEYPEVRTHKLAVLCPGSLDNAETERFLTLTRDLIGKSYAVARFDPTDTWESADDLLERTTTHYINNIKKIIEYMLGREKYSYILLAGYGWGAIVSLLYAGADTRISAVLGIMPEAKNSHEVSAVPVEGEEISANHDEGDKKIIFDVPLSYLEDASQYDIADEIKKSRASLIFLIGNSSMAVKLEDVKEIPVEAAGAKKLVITGDILDETKDAFLDTQKISEAVLRQIE